MCLARLLLSYRSIPHAGRTSSPSALMGRQTRSPMTTAFINDEPLWYHRTGQPPGKARFIVQHGPNTAIVTHGNNETAVLAHMDQLRPAFDTNLWRKASRLLMKNHHLEVPRFQSVMRNWDSRVGVTDVTMECHPCALDMRGRCGVMNDMKHYCVNCYMYLFFVCTVLSAVLNACASPYLRCCMFEQRDIILNKHFEILKYFSPLLFLFVRFHSHF